jgi:hypothetical protein
MNDYFATIKQIVLSKGSKDAKIKKMIDDLKCTRYEANHFYQLVMHVEKGTQGERSSERVARRSFTMGVEIECFGFSKRVVREALQSKGVLSIETGYDHNDQKKANKLGHDGSIMGENSCEVVSPILKNLKSLKVVCDTINEHGARVNSSCGLHIHLGAEQLTLAQWVRIIKNYARIEAIIDSFMAESRRANNNVFCKSIVEVADRIENGSVNEFRDIENAFRLNRYHKVNVMSFRRHKTIEFRQHQGTTDFNKIKMWAEFLTALVNYSIDHGALIEASTINDLPFLNKAQKQFFNDRKNALN